MVEAADLKAYVERVEDELFGARYRRPTGGTVCEVLDVVGEERLANLKKNKFVRMDRRAELLRDPEFTTALGKAAVEEIINSDDEVHMNALGWDHGTLTDMVRERLVIGKYIQPAVERNKVMRHINERCKEYYEIWEKLKTEIYCGAVDDPLLAVRDFMNTEWKYEGDSEADTQGR